jgi:hypothetical protein
VLTAGKFGTDKVGHAELLAAGRRLPEQRVWVIEGCNGIGKRIPHRLVVELITLSVLSNQRR